uniref:ERp29 N-terminal domain-containing protein n=1 Tax=Glossina brevipalpis TaxID=37001 RepID=A0A1A9VZF7_9MUSC
MLIRYVASNFVHHDDHDKNYPTILLFQKGNTNNYVQFPSYLVITEEEQQKRLKEADELQEKLTEDLVIKLC